MWRLALSVTARAPIIAAASLVLAAVLLAGALFVLDGGGVRESRGAITVEDTRLVVVTGVRASPGDVVMYAVAHAAPETFAPVRFVAVPGGEGASVARGNAPSRILAEHVIEPGAPCCGPALRIDVPDGVVDVDIVKELTYADARRPSAGDARAWFDRYVKSEAADVGGTPVVYPRAIVLVHDALGWAGVAAAIGGVGAALWSVRPATIERPSGQREAGVGLVANAHASIRAVRAVGIVVMMALVLGGGVLVGAAGQFSVALGAVGLATVTPFVLLAAWVGVLFAWSAFLWRAHRAARRLADALADAPIPH